MNRKDLNILFLGLGSIGERHVKILRKLGYRNIYALRTYQGALQKRISGVKDLDSWLSVDRVRPDIAFITNPTSKHIETALLCARRGMNLFIEKPIGSSLKGLTALKQTVLNRKLSTYVAYVLRFHPVIRFLKMTIRNKQVLHVRVAVSTHLHRWRPYKNSYSSQKDMGGGVILDLSHELDYIEYLLGEIRDIKGRSSREGKVTVDAEDNVDYILDTEVCPVTIHQNIFSQREQRMIQIELAKESIAADLKTGKVEIFKNGKRDKVVQLKPDLRGCFLSQIEYFMHNLNNPRMMNNLFDASGLFQKIVRFRNRSTVNRLVGI